MRRFWARLAMCLTVIVAATTLMATPAKAASQTTTAGEGVWLTWYSTGVVITFSRWNTGLIAASSAFTPVWVASSALNGQLGNELNQNIWMIQVRAAWEAANNKCLWVWVPLAGDAEAGGYTC